MSHTSTPAGAFHASADLLDGHAVYDAVPLGALIRYSDGTPRPPERFTRKLRAWKGTNGTGRLVEKSPPSALVGATYPAGFTLHEGDFASNGIIVMVVRRIYHVTTAMHFEIVELPQAGAVRLLTRWNGRDELKYLASHMAAAEAWMQRNRYSNLVTEIVGSDEPSVQIGRAA